MKGIPVLLLFILMGASLSFAELDVQMDDNTSRLGGQQVTMQHSKDAAKTVYDRAMIALSHGKTRAQSFLSWLKKPIVHSPHSNPFPATQKVIDHLKAERELQILLGRSPDWDGLEAMMYSNLSSPDRADLAAEASDPEWSDWVKLQIRLDMPKRHRKMV